MAPRGDNTSDSSNKLFIALGFVVVAALAIGFVWWVFSQRDTTTPEEIAKSYVDDNIDDLSEEIAGFIVFEVPVLSILAKELGGEYLEGLIHDVVEWDYSAERSGDDDIYEVTATSRVSLVLDVEGLVEGEVEVSLPFLIVVDMDEQSVRRASPQLADASFSANLLGLPDIAALNNVLPGADKLNSVIAKAADAVSKRVPVAQAPQAPVTPADSSVRAPEKTVSFADSLESCVFAALEDELSGILIEKIEETDPRALTDRQRWEWFNVLQEVANDSDVVVACQDLWSEPITTENADKRNRIEEFYSDCVSGYDRGEQGNGGHGNLIDMIASTHSADVLNLLERPYRSLSLTDRVVLRMIFGDDDGCWYYYPQLFFGRWIPVLDPDDL